ncbi:MAG: hypothetical protein BWY15_02031 [Firmicutes bacterium ADurb.Bin193]|nr:MAG: hypothetical protein BWY15_02031 [Firmicutes bacterium ADurb.Bin193]
MTGVLTLFGETDLQSALHNSFRQNELYFVRENAVTDVQLMGFCEENAEKTDVVIIAGNAVNLSTFTSLAAEIINIDSYIRIILILNGKRSHYIRSQLERYKAMKIDLIFDDNGFDVGLLVDLVKKGRLESEKKKVSGFQEEYPDEIIDIEDAPASFINPAGHYKIAVMNATHGAGATSVVVSLARYFELHNYKTAAMDLSGNYDLELAGLKNIEVSADAADIDKLNQKCNILLIDFGTPYHIPPQGDSFKIEQGYNSSNLKEIKHCDLKLVTGFADTWNIGKIKFFFENEQWAQMVDNSYMFLVTHNAEKLRIRYPDANIFNRDDDYTEMIFNAIRKDDYSK